MALTRKFLSALGIDDDKVDEIIRAHSDTVNGLKDEIEKYKADAEKLPAVEKELKELKDANAEYEGKNPYKVKYEALKEEYADYKKGIDEKESKAKKEAAYKALLKEAGVSEKRIESVLKVSDIDALEFDEEGKAKNGADLIKSIKEECRSSPSRIRVSPLRRICVTSRHTFSESGKHPLPVHKRT